MSLIKEDRIYFYGLDELRAIAALLVYFHHVELFKTREGFAPFLGGTFYDMFTRKIGHNSVVAFFVLSGFLITYLLLKEKEVTGTIKIKAFYLRRIFRIWPLYFLVVFIGFVIMPLLNSTGLFEVQKYYTGRINNLEYESLTLFVLFLSNFAVWYYKPVAGAAQSWSVSVEEQFYLIWPNIVKWIKSIKHLLILIIFVLILKVWGVKLFISLFGSNPIIHGVEIISIEFMFVGAIAAVLLYWDKTKETVIKVMGNPYLFVFTLMALVAQLFFFKIPITLAFTFAALILHVSILKIEIKFLKYFGKISYGIYMLHPLALYLVFPIAFSFKGSIPFSITFFILSFIITIVLAGLSYKYFEQPILRFKNKHTIIKSGAN